MLTIKVKGGTFKRPRPWPLLPSHTGFSDNISCLLPARLHFHDIALVCAHTPVFLRASRALSNPI